MMYDLERLKRTTKIKLVFMSISIIIPIIAMFILEPLSRKYFSDYVKLPVKVLRDIALAFGEIFILSKILYYIRILSSEAFAKNVLIKKNDERLIFIKQKYAVFTIKMLFFLLLIGIIISGFLSTAVFITLCGVAGVLFITTFITWLYYSKKY